ncbi:hypothetical protein EDD11_003409 [Mortierella claussenii]|nr:hypothetical protein EDD11_003409 [Mortierella claussenii]
MLLNVEVMLDIPGNCPPISTTSVIVLDLGEINTITAAKVDHKIHPVSGAGAVNAIYDAVALSNWISVLGSPSVKDTKRIFKAYKEERYLAALASFNTGQTLTKVSGSDWKSKIVRFEARNMPGWFHQTAAKKIVHHRPQVLFLPLVKDSETLEASHQLSLEETLVIKKAKGTLMQAATAL